MSYIPRENKMHPNIKLLRQNHKIIKSLDRSNRRKKSEPYWQHGLKNLLNMAEQGCAIIYPRDFLATCHLILLTWNLTWALKPRQNYVQTRLFPQQPVQNMSLKQRKCIKYCSIQKLRKIGKSFSVVWFLYYYYLFILTGL